MTLEQTTRALAQKTKDDCRRGGHEIDVADVVAVALAVARDHALTCLRMATPGRLADPLDRQDEIAATLAAAERGHL